MSSALAVAACWPAAAHAVAFTWSSKIPLTASGLLGVSCPSGTECVAVDSAGEVVAFNPNAPGVPTPVTIDAGTGLVAVACPSVSQCTAIDGNGHELTFDPSAPGGAVPTLIDSRNGLNALACPSTTECVAVDQFANEVTFNPTMPGTPQPSPIDAAANGLAALACPAANQCTTVDRVGAAITFDPFSPGLPGSTVVDNVNGQMTAITCPSITSCVALDAFGRAVTFNPSRPKVSTMAQIDSGNILRAVACPAVDECVAVDQVGQAFVADPGDPYSWTLESVEGPNTLLGVDCPSVALCVAVDNQGSAFAGVALPVSPSPPSISGAAVEGQTLTDQHAPWSPAPTAYAYRWQRCDASGSACVPISGAAGQTYTLTSADLGSTIRVQETASDAAGTGPTLTSAPTAVVKAPAPPGGGRPGNPPGPPNVTGFAITNKRFAVGARGTRPPGTAFRYALSEPATVRIRIAQRLSDRRRGQRCVAPVAQLRHARTCTRVVARGTLNGGGRQGANRLAFSGRVGGRALRPGRYQATLTATDTAGRASGGLTVFFTVVAR